MTFFVISGIILLLNKWKRTLSSFFDIQFFGVNGYRRLKFFMAFFAPIVIMFLFVKYVVAIFFISTPLPLVVFPITIGSCIFLSLLVTNLSVCIERKRKKIFILIVILLVSFSGQFIYTQYTHLTETMPIKSLPGHNVLHKYKNHSFGTNMSIVYVYYFTNEWAKTLRKPVSYNTVKQFIEDDRHINARDKFTNTEKYLYPDYLFIANLKPFPHFSYPEATFRKYHLVEKGDDFWIFDLRKEELSKETKYSTEITDEQFEKLYASQRRLTPVDFYTNGIHSPSFPAKAAFDGDRKTMWHSPQSIGTLGWLTVKLAHPAKLRKLAVTIRDDNAPNQAPNWFIIEGSNDNQNWSHITEAVDLEWNVKGETKKINVTNANRAYLYYKFDFTVNKHAQWISIAEIELYGN